MKSMDTLNSVHSESRVPAATLLTSLNARFLAVASLAVVTVIAFAFVSYQGLSQQVSANEGIRNIAKIVQRHMDADMKHDAINSSVLAAKIAAAEKRSEDLAEAQKAFQEDSEDFRKDVAENLKEDLPTDIRSKLQAVEVALTAYIQAGQNVMSALANGGDSKSAFAVFSDRFDFLEQANEAVSEDLLALADKSAAESERVASTTKAWLAILASIALLLAVATPIYAAFSVFRPLKKAIAIASEIAGGRAEVVVPYTRQRNELGEIARSIDVFRCNLVSIREMTETQQQQRAAADRERREAMRNLARAFETRVETIIASVASAAGDLLGTAKTMSETAETTSQRATHAVSESRGAEESAQAVAAAVEEMSAAAREIANQITQSGTVVHNAVSQVNGAEATSSQLADANAKIGNIVELIRNITGQINLLALNATIESARAGEAGKGFAVVANEVKNLASQTSKATEQIAEQITQIQDVSREVVLAFSSIKQLIGQVEQYSATVAAAAEQQTMTTHEIASNMATTARGTSAITQHIGEVMDASKGSSSAAYGMLSAAKVLSDQSGKLRLEVSTFLDEVRAA